MSDVGDAEFRMGGGLEYGDAGELNAAITYRQSTPRDPIDEEVFAPTDRPDEPITQGMPFGPGDNFSASPDETEGQRLARIATSMLQTPGTPDDAVVWAARQLGGF